MEEEIQKVVRQMLREELRIDISSHSDFYGSGFEVTVSLGDEEITKDHFHLTTR